MRHGCGMLKVLSAIAVAVTVAPAAQTPNITWYNTTETHFNISTAEQLFGLAQIVNGTAKGAARDGFAGKMIFLTQNINLAAYTDWEPIGRTAGNGFAGTFDGGRHVISNLVINRPDSINQGLFGWIGGGTVERLGVENVHITGGASVGALAGYLDGGIVADCYTTGVVRGAGSVGGVAGTAVESSVIKNCYSTAAAIGGVSAGGIVGYMANSSVSDCAALNPEVRGDSIGRVAGSTGGGAFSGNAGYAGMGNSAGDTVWANKGQGELNGEDITLAAVSGDGTIGNRFKGPVWETGNGKLPGYAAALGFPAHFSTIYRITVSPSSGLLVGKGRTMQFTESIIGENANRTVTWAVSGRTSTATTVNAGLLTVAANENADLLRVIAVSSVNPAVSDTVTVTVVDVAWYNSAAVTFNIASPNELAGLAAIVNGTWGGTPAMDNFAGKTVRLTRDVDLARYGNWIPVGNLAVDTSDTACTFSGTFNGGGHVVKNLTINTAGGNNAGSRRSGFHGLFGHVIKGGRVDSLGVVDVSINSSFVAGAVVGRLWDSSTVSGSYSAGVIAGAEVSGGVAGAVERNSSVIRSYSTAAVSGASAGGVAGRADTGSVVSNSYFAGTVGSTGLAGGVAGFAGMGTAIADCYFSGKVSGVNNVGGIAGVLSASTVISSYTTGEVSGSDTVGGVAGRVSETGFVGYCAALNSRVAAAGGSVGRIAGNVNDLVAGMLETNAAFDGMLNRAGNTAWGNKGAGDADGADTQVSAIRIDPSIGGRFTGINGWTTAADKLPGFGAAVDFPAQFGPVVYSVSVTPAEVSVGRGMRQQFTANVSLHNGASPAVVWTLFGDALHRETVISPSGLLTIAANDSSTSITVMAASIVDDRKFATAEVTPALSGAIVISGMIGASPRVGETLIAAIGGGFALGELTYSWTIDGTEVDSGDTYVVTAADLGKVIKLAITSSLETGSLNVTLSKVESSNAPITAARPTITVQPLSGPVAIGTEYILYVKAVGSGTLSYQWYSAEDESGGGGKIINGWTVDSLTIHAVPASKLGTYYYFVVVTNTIEDNKDGGKKTAADTSAVAAVTVVEFVAVASQDRVIPAAADKDAALIAPVKAITGRFTAGPNPAGRSLGIVKFYRQGGWIKNGKLTVYDASGNAVSKVSIGENAAGELRATPVPDTSRRIVGSWDFTDRKGRTVSDGTYLLRGVIITADGKKERVSLKIGVR